MSKRQFVEGGEETEINSVSTTLMEEPVAASNPCDLQCGEQSRPPTNQDAKPTPPSRGSRWPWIVVIAAAVGIGAGYGYARVATGSHGEASARAETGQRAGKATLGFTSAANAGAQEDRATSHLGTISAELVRQSQVLRLTGSLTGDEQSNVASNVTGIVAEVRVDRGSVVRRGDVLVQLDPTDAKNRLAEGLALVEEFKSKLTLGDESAPFVAEDQPEVKLAKASLDLALSRRQRAERLMPSHAISGEDFDAAQAEHRSAEQRHRKALQDVRKTYQEYQTHVVRLAALRKAVADTTIRAPFDGMVVQKHVALGEQVTGGFIASNVVTIVRTDPLRLALTVPQQNVAQIKPDQKVLFRVDAFPDRTFEARVRYVSPVVTNETRSLIADAVVPNADGLLRPGLFATAELQLPEQKPEVLVPMAAVQRMNEVARVFVVQDGVARAQVVALGKTVQDKVAVTSGLSGKEVLVARPELVRDGDVVRK